MADWYASSVVYATIPPWQATHAYAVGDFVRPTAPSFASQIVYRCTTAGTSAASEPSWSVNNNTTTTSGGAVFTAVGGQSAYAWAAPLGNICTALGSTRAVVGDRVFASSDSVENQPSGGNAYDLNGITTAFGAIQIISVNRAGSVPPGEADIQNGASISYSVVSGGLSLNAFCSAFWQGITFTLSGSSVANFFFNSTALAKKNHYLKNCAIVLTSTLAGTRITTSNEAKVTFDNTTVQFGNVGQAIGNTGPFDFTWINTPNAIQGAIIPTVLFNYTSAIAMQVTCRGVDLSAVTTTLCSPTTGLAGVKALFDSCKIASGVTRLATPNTNNSASDEVELVNCWDGSNVLNERWTPAGAVTTDRGTYLTGGAQDDVSAYGFKLASSARSDKSTLTSNAFVADVGNTAIGVSKIATVELISPGSLNNDDISLLLEYIGASGSSLANFVNGLPAVLAAPSALPASSAIWTAPTQYATWNPLDVAGILSNGNLTLTGTSGTEGARSTFNATAGGYYWEVKFPTWVNDNTGPGIALITANVFNNVAVVGVVSLARNGAIWLNGNPTGTSLGMVAPSGSTVGIAADFTGKLIWFRLVPTVSNWNGSGTANPATGVGGVNFSVLSGPFAAWISDLTNAPEVATANFGASAFVGIVPSGFTAGLPTTPTVKQLLQVTFTPQRAGRVRGLIRLGKPLTQCWVNPQLVIT